MEKAIDDKYEIHTLDLTSEEVKVFNPMSQLDNLKFEEKYSLLEMLYQSATPSFLPCLPMTVTNFKIQEYRAKQSKNVLEFMTRNFQIPTLFPVTRQEYEKIVSVVQNDNNMYECPLYKKVKERCETKGLNNKTEMEGGSSCKEF